MRALCHQAQKQAYAHEYHGKGGDTPDQMGFGALFLIVPVIRHRMDLPVGENRMEAGLHPKGSRRAARLRGWTAAASVVMRGSQGQSKIIKSTDDHRSGHSIHIGRTYRARERLETRPGRPEARYLAVEVLDA